jgi:hypothetical protein
LRKRVWFDEFEDSLPSMYLEVLELTDEEVKRIEEKNSCFFFGINRFI